MQFLKSMAFLFFALIALHSSAQTNTPLLFPGTTPRARFNETNFMTLFTKDANAIINISSLDNFQLKGVVLSNDFNADMATRIVIIRLTNFQEGTLLKLKSVTLNGKTTYKATISNVNYDDAYQLSSIFDGWVVLSKFNKNQIEELAP